MKERKSRRRKGSQEMREARRMGVWVRGRATARARPGEAGPEARGAARRTQHKWQERPGGADSETVLSKLLHKVSFCRQEAE